MRLLAALLLTTLPTALAAAPALTPFTASSGAPRAQEQLAMVFEKADLQLRVDPRRRSIEGDAALTFRAESALNRLAVELDRNLGIRSIAVDDVAIAKGQWTNPDGRLFITLPKPLAAGE